MIIMWSYIYLESLHLAGTLLWAHEQSDPYPPLPQSATESFALLLKAQKASTCKPLAVNYH